MDVHEIKVLVPSERVTEFYRWFADWRDGAPPTATATPNVEAPARVVSVAGEARLSAAVKWWRSLKPSERGIWGLWIEASPQLLTADQIVSELGLKGVRDIPGILSWSGRKGKRVGFPVHWQFEYDAITGAPLYGLRDVDGLSAVEYGDLLRRARAEAEG